MCRPSRLAVLFALCAASIVAASPVWAAEAESDADRAGIEFFETRIRPVLVKHCYECHSAEAENLQGGLLLDVRQGLLAGGDSGPAVMPGKPDESLLIEALRYESYEMPPSGKLPDEVIADFVKWIERGAPDPRDGAAKVVKYTIDIEAGRQFWSFQPPMRHSIPQPQNAAWSYTPVDRFILARLEQEGLEPAADADRRALLRRAYFDVIGLPPSPEEIAAFLADESPDAFARVVDRLLESPHFGERWGRHWLDVARFSETTGGGRSMLFGDAWRYRDYVIQALNDDKPYDRFIVEQLAGDLLPYDDYRRGQEQVLATAFLTLGPTNYELQDKTQLEFDVVDEQIDTTGRALLGMTLGCARCHDHKFDPIPTADYYALAGIFRSTKTLIHDNVSTWVKRPLPVDDEMRQAIEEHQQLVTNLRREANSRQSELDRLRRFFPIVTLDDDDARLVGSWSVSKSVQPFVGQGYRYASGEGAAAVYDVTKHVEPGRYEVRVAYTPHGNRSSNTLVRVEHAEGETDVRIDQTEPPPIAGLYVSLGEFEFDPDGSSAVTISTEGAEQVVIADAVQLVPLFRLEKPASPRGRIVPNPAELPGIVVDDTAAELTGTWNKSSFVSSYVGEGYVHDGADEKGQKSIAFRADLPRSGEYEVRVAYSRGENRATRVPVNVIYEGGDRTVYVNQREVPQADGLFASLGTFRFANDQTAVVTVLTEGTDDGHVIADAVQFIPIDRTDDSSQDDDQAGDASSLTSTLGLSDDEIAALDAAELRERMVDLEAELGRTEGEIDSLDASAPDPPAEVLSVEDAAEPDDCHLLIRGEIKNLGPVVPRGFVQVASGGDVPEIPADSSGRLELARWVASPDNPLTARVMVNRIWHHLFGSGLVRTVDNFGTQGERPSHPELLDYLALEFVEQGWSVKSLIRHVMLSRVYQQSSTRNESAIAIDPDNRLLASQNRRRLDAEALYDSILSLGGALDLTMGGDTIRPGTKLEYDYRFDDDGRRAVYLPVMRNRLHDLFAVFDFPDPNLPIGRRNVSTLSTQALFLMNSPLVMDQAESAARHLLAEEKLNDDERVTLLYERALGRLPTDAERALSLEYVAATDSGDDAQARLDRWTGLCQAMISCIDFRYID